MFEPIDKSFDKDSLQTPKYIFDWLDSIYCFIADLAASHEHHYCANYFTKERSFFDRHRIDFAFIGLGSAFCNPPYSNIDPWLEKAAGLSEYEITTVFLIPELNGEKRTKLIMENAINIFHFDKRISFIRPDNGQEYKGSNRGSIVVEFGHRFIKNPPVHHYISLDEIRNKFDK